MALIGEMFRSRLSCATTSSPCTVYCRISLLIVVVIEVHTPIECYTLCLQMIKNKKKMSTHYGIYKSKKETCTNFT